MNEDIIEYTEFHCEGCQSKFEQFAFFAVMATCPQCRTAAKVYRYARKFGMPTNLALLLGVVTFAGYQAKKHGYIQ